MKRNNRSFGRNNSRKIAGQGRGKSRHGKSQRQQRCFATHLERLEERTLLAGNILASLDSHILGSGETTELALTISGSSPAVVGFHVQSGSTGNFDPAAPLITNASGNRVSPLLSQADMAGRAESLVLAELAPGEYIITAGGDRGSFGDFTFDVFMPGDMNNNNSVSDYEQTYCMAATAQTAGNWNFVTALLFKQKGINLSNDLYCTELDANLDGKIDNTDLKYVRMNANLPGISIELIGDSSPPVIEAGLLNDSGSSTFDGITNDATITGSVTDASEITSFGGRFDGAADYVDLLTELDASGNFQFDLTKLEQIAAGPLANNGEHTL